MGNDLKHFFALKSVKQVEYLKGSEFEKLDRKDRIHFLKTILTPDLPSITTACALRILRELNYPDRYFFRKFLYHLDSTVTNAARKAISECCSGREDQCNKMVKVLNEGVSDDRMLLADFFLQEIGKVNENLLISFLSIDDTKVRENIIKKITIDYELDDSLLSDTLTKGSTWYLRAALVEILGKRRSHHLFDHIDFLINDKNVEVKLKLIQALTNYEIDKRKGYLLKLAADSLIWVRKEANRALMTC